MIRSLLIAQAGDAAALARSVGAGADGMILTLDGPADRPFVLASLREAKRVAAPPRLIVRVAAFDAGGEEEIVALFAEAAPDGVAAATESAADVQRIGVALAVAEARAGLADGAIGILPIVATAAALFGLPGLALASPRLLAIGWDGEALAADLGADRAREAEGDWIDPCRTARSLVLAAAAAGRTTALDAPFSRGSVEALRREAALARRDGFAGKLVRDADQAQTVNAVFAARPDRE